MGNDEIVLWTFQNMEDVLAAWRSGQPYRCCPFLVTYGGLLDSKGINAPDYSRASYVNSSQSGIDSSPFKRCYQWISDVMRESIKPSPSYVDETSRPIWAWAKWTDNNGIGQTKPDLRYMAFRGERNVCKNALIGFAMSRDNVLLSDFDLWHLPLNGIAIDDEYRYIDEETSHIEVKSIMDTWHSCIVDRETPFDEMPEWTQACVWEIPEKSVFSMRRLN